MSSEQKDSILDPSPPTVVPLHPLLSPVAIGSLVLDGGLFLAPVAGYTDNVFRSICTQWGANFCYTEMVSAQALVRGNKKTLPLMQKGKKENLYALQIFGGEPRCMAQAARIALETTHANLIDINCGCPVPKINKSGAGCSLGCSPAKLFDVITAIKKEIHSIMSSTGLCPPVSIKIRSGLDINHITFLDAAKAAIEAGVDAITLHPRTKAQGYEGQAFWQHIKDLVDYSKKTTQGKVPIFASGDILSPESVLQVIQKTNCQGVMIARGALGNPFIFSQTKQLIKTGHYTLPTKKQKIDTAMQELQDLSLQIGQKAACRQMRKRFCAYLKGLAGGAAMRQKIVASCTILDYKTATATGCF